MSESPESTALLRAYFEAHESAMNAVTGEAFARHMAAANVAAQRLRIMPVAAGVDDSPQPPAWVTGRTA